MIQNKELNITPQSHPVAKYKTTRFRCEPVRDVTNAVVMLL